MPRLRRGDVIWIPVDDKKEQRPALVVSSQVFNDLHRDVLVVAITTKKYPHPTKCPITDLKTAGLPSPSFVTSTVRVIDPQHVRTTRVGRLTKRDMQAVDECLKIALDLDY